MRVDFGTCDDIEGCDGSGGGQPGAGGGEGDLLVGGLVHHVLEEDGHLGKVGARHHHQQQPQTHFAGRLLKARTEGRTAAVGDPRGPRSPRAARAPDTSDRKRRRNVRAKSEAPNPTNTQVRQKRGTRVVASNPRHTRGAARTPQPIF